MLAYSRGGCASVAHAAKRLGERWVAPSGNESPEKHAPRAREGNRTHLERKAQDAHCQLKISAPRRSRRGASVTTAPMVPAYIPKLRDRKSSEAGESAHARCNLPAATRPDALAQVLKLFTPFPEVQKGTLHFGRNYVPRKRKPCSVHYFVCWLTWSAKGKKI
jgi:hypothetical protein